MRDASSSRSRRPPRGRSGPRRAGRAGADGLRGRRRRRAQIAAPPPSHPRSERTPFRDSPGSRSPARSRGPRRRGEPARGCRRRSRRRRRRSRSAGPAPSSSCGSRGGSGDPVRLVVCRDHDRDQAVVIDHQERPASRIIPERADVRRSPAAQPPRARPRGGRRGRSPPSTRSPEGLRERRLDVGERRDHVEGRQQRPGRVGPRAPAADARRDRADQGQRVEGASDDPAARDAEPATLRAARR